MSLPVFAKKMPFNTDRFKEVLVQLAYSLLAMKDPDILDRLEKPLFETAETNQLPPGLTYLKFRSIEFDKFVADLRTQYTAIYVDSILPVPLLKHLATHIMRVFQSTPEESIEMMEVLCQADPFAFALASEMIDMVPFPEMLKEKYFVERFRAYLVHTTDALNETSPTMERHRLMLINEYLDASYVLETEFRFSKFYTRMIAMIGATVRFRKVYVNGEWVFGFIFTEPNYSLPPGHCEPITYYTYVQCLYDMVGREMPQNSELIHFCELLNIKKISDDVSRSKQELAKEFFLQILNGDDSFWSTA